MFQDISNKKKFYGLVFLFLVFSILSYKKSFSKTAGAISSYHSAQNKTSEIADISNNYSELKREIKLLDSRIGQRSDNPAMVQNRILEFLSQHDSKIRISKIENTHISRDDYFTIYSNIITLKGTYNELSRTLFRLETEFDYARITSIKMHTSRNPSTKQKELFNSYIFQNYEKNN